jgi:serine/threonine protein kinase/formylglycine-generating enzyme required for sulfatase activity
MADVSEDRDVLLNRLADEFAGRHRAGQRPSVEDYCDRYPILADDIRSLFPAMVELEQVKADAGPELAVDVTDTPPITELGEFRLLREIGRGGMGVVYEAEQVSLGRRVAIKLLPASVFRDPARRGRFEREAKAAARLHHTNIVPVFGVGEQDGTPYYVMQFIPGLALDIVIEELGLQPSSGSGPGTNRPPTHERTALSAAIAQSLVGSNATGSLPGSLPANDGVTVTAAGAGSPGPGLTSRHERGAAMSLSASGVHLPGQPRSGSGRTTGSKATYWGSVARIGLQVAEALAYAHKLGVLHRDVKPGNLLLDLDGVVWVTDFGLAKAADSDDLTHTGDVLGTLRYMPPEAFEGKSDARSDVYSLGLTLFELVALRPAYQERDRKKLIKLVTTGEPPRLGRLRPDAPRDLITIIEKAIDRDPARRYPTAGALADDLQRFLDRRPILARRASAAEKVVRWAKRNPVVAGAGVAVLLALAAGTTVSYLKYLDAERHRAFAETQQAEAERQAGIAQAEGKEARRQAEKAQKARDFLVSIFRISERDLRTGNITARQILADAERRIPTEFANQPELRDELITAIADVKRGIARRVPQAMILEATGAVRLRSADGTGKPAVPQALVNLDDRLTLAPDARVRLVFLADFHKETIKPGREVTVDERGCEPAGAIQERDNSILMSFVRLPKGTFYMGGGSPDPKTGRPKKGVKTQIPEDFEIAVHAVTQGQWTAVMGNNSSFFSRTGTVRWRVQDISDEELKLFPADDVSWEDAQAFVQRLNTLERGRGYRYRLPTEAEWEYACRGAATSEEECSYPFYTDRPTRQLTSNEANFNGNYPAGGAPKGPFLGRTTRVGAYPPNRLGLCDMHGNVWQWCEAPFPGSPQVAGRGGMYGADGANCEVSFRSVTRPSFHDGTRGFRLVRVRTQ